MTTRFPAYRIKSFKHDGCLHRMWLENWRVPDERLDPAHAEAGMAVLVNECSRVVEADGTEWTTRVPGVAFFIPGEWFNIVALIEDNGVRYYCNIASPFNLARNVITYVDYDLDVIVDGEGQALVVDEDEYNRHKAEYRYPHAIDTKVRVGLERLMERIRAGLEPFRPERVMPYYEHWRTVMPLFKKGRNGM